MFSKQNFIKESFSYGIPAIVLLSGNTILAASLLIGSELQQKFFDNSLSSQAKGFAKNVMKAVGVEKPKNFIDLIFEHDQQVTKHFIYPAFKDYCEEESFCKGVTYLNLFTLALAVTSTLTLMSTPFILPVLGLYSGVLLSRAGQELDKEVFSMPRP